MDRGVLEASQLKSAFESLEKEQGGPIKTVDDVLKWPLVATAVKEGVVGSCSSSRTNSWGGCVVVLLLVCVYS